MGGARQELRKRFGGKRVSASEARRQEIEFLENQIQKSVPKSGVSLHFRESEN
jgi:hypothetical protein